MTDVKVVQPGQGDSMPFLDGSVMSFLVRGEDTKQAISFWEFTLPGGAQGPPAHRHNGHDEVFYIVEGELMVHTGGEPLAAPKGAMVIVPRGAEHTFWNAQDEVTRMVGVFAPSRFEHYFEELAREIDKHRGERVAPSVIANLYAKYDSELLI